MTPRLLPLPRTDWSPPMPPEAWSSHSRVWQSWFGGFDRWAAYQPQQPERQGFALLLFREQSSVGFVKVRPEWEFTHEYRAQASVQGAETFDVPIPVGVHVDRGWSTLGMTSLPAKIHKPGVLAEPERVTEEISDMLEVAQPVPKGWSPAHGDLGPWNLRRLSHSRPFIVDWEHAAPLPSGSDLVFYVAAARATGIPVRSRLPLQSYREAIEFWSDTIPIRFGASSRDRQLAEKMLQTMKPDARA